MVLEEIYNTLLTVINVDMAVWLPNTTLVISYILTCLFIIIFLTIPIFIFYSFLGFFIKRNKNKKRYY